MWRVSRIQKSFQRNKMQQRDTVQRGFICRAYFTAEILTSVTPLKAVLLCCPIQIEDDHFPIPMPPALLLSEPLLPSPYNKLDHSFPPSLRGTALKNLDLCEHSMGLFHSSNWPMNTCLENKYCHCTVFLLRKEKLCLLGQQWSKLGMWFTKFFVSSDQALQ